MPCPSDPTVLGHVVLALLTVLLLLVSAAAVSVVERSIQRGLRGAAKNSARAQTPRPAYTATPTTNHG